MSLQFQKAAPAASHLRMALCGGPGAGKTWTSLALASGLGGKVALIDTERGSARQYAGDFDFDVCELDSFHPQHYIDAMLAAAQEGYDVLIVDSLSHAWAGKDGALELVDRASASSKDNRMSAWRQVTPLHHQLVDTMLRLPLHLIATLRTKVAYVIETDARGQHAPRQISLAPVQREGCEYEFDVMGLLQDAVLRITKTRLRFLHGLVLEPDPQDPIAPGLELGRCIAADLQGKPVVPAASAAARRPEQQATPQALKALWTRITQHQVSHDAFRRYLAQMGVDSTKALSPRQLAACLREIDARRGQAFEPQGVPDDEHDAATQEARAHLFQALTRLQAEIAEAEQTQPPGEPYAQTLINLAQWTPRVARACERPDTPEDQLRHYLAEVQQSLDDLQRMTAAADGAMGDVATPHAQ